MSDLPEPAQPASGARSSTLSTRKTWLLRGIVLGFSLGFSLFCAEVVLRAMDGFRLGSLALKHRPVQSATPSPAVGRFAEEYSQLNLTAAGVDADWISTSPELASPAEPTPEVVARDDVSPHLNYLWNDALLDQFMSVENGPIEDLRKLRPAEFFLFPAPGGIPHPRYRYPGNASFPSGFVTDRFGFRSRKERTFAKPPRTVRIFCVGASTTVSNHRYAFSYPELVEHWFSLWAERQGLPIAVEVWNAGREGIDSRDIAAVVETEVVPLDPDLIFYYEGSNQFDPGTVVEWNPALATRGEPPESLLSKNLQLLATRSGPTGLWRYSAVYRRFVALLDSYRAPEIPKPRNDWRLPEGLTEFEPDLSKIGNALNLGQILSDLERCRVAAESTGAVFVLSSFRWLVEDGLLLDRGRNRGIYVYLNKSFYPFTYANLRRAADFQNRVFGRWAAERDVPMIPVDEEMPNDPSWFVDAIHNTPDGVRVRAWIVFNHLVPLVAENVRTGEWPRPARFQPGDPHPVLRPEAITRRKFSAAN